MNRAAGEAEPLLGRDKGSGRAPHVQGYPPSIKYIVCNEFCERFCYYGIRSVLLLYLTCSLGFSGSTSVLTMHTFIAAAYLAPLIGGALSDGYIGKYSTILYLSIVYALGAGVLAASAYPGFGIHTRTTGLFAGLGLIALGTGGIKPCVSAFGGDQFHDIGGKEGSAQKLQSFFTLFYWSINAGSTLSMLITPLLRHMGCPGCASAENMKPFASSGCTFVPAFAVPAGLMSVSIVVFVMGRYCVGYRQNQSIDANSDGVLSRFIRVVFLRTPRERHEHKERGGDSEGSSGRDIIVDRASASWYDQARAIHGSAAASEARRALRVLAMMTPFPLFWCLFDQTASTWVLQASRMDGSLGNGWTILPDQMGVLNALLILLLLPVFDGGVYPLVRRCGLAATPLERMAAGMFAAGLAFAAAGAVETQIDACAGERPCLHMAWQVPQYALLTIGEVLFSVTGLEFAYREAPRSMRALMQSAWLLTVCAGNVLVVVFELVVHSARLGAAESFFLCSGLMGAALCWFGWIAQGYTYAKDEQAMEIDTQHKTAP